MVGDSRGPLSNKADHRGERLVVLALAGILALNYPLLELFNEPRLVLGIPLLYLYLFLVWAGLIGLGAWVLEGKGQRRRRADGQSSDHRRY